MKYPPSWEMVAIQCELRYLADVERWIWIWGQHKGARLPQRLIIREDDAGRPAYVELIAVRDGYAVQMNVARSRMRSGDIDCYFDAVIDGLESRAGEVPVAAPP